MRRKGNLASIPIRKGAGDVCVQPLDGTCFRGRRHGGAAGREKECYGGLVLGAFQAIAVVLTEKMVSSKAGFAALLYQIAMTLTVNVKLQVHGVHGCLEAR
jgi:hypothetical protein